jgi:hypothetical protein
MKIIRAVREFALCFRPEVEVRSIILAKVSRLCRVTVVGFLLGYRFLNPQDLAYGFL